MKTMMRRRAAGSLLVSGWAIGLTWGLAGCAGLPAPGGGAELPPGLTTKTPYQPRQLPSALEPVPAGFKPVHTQLVARHGTRGLTSPKQELALLAMWQAAADEGALTPLGQGLGADLQALIRANALLGAGVEGITRPGYANLTRIGMAEHEGLARRVLSRVPGLFENPAANGAGGGDIVVLNSGVDRARDSAEIFTRTLLAERPELAARIIKPVLRAYPEAAPRAQAAGTNRFLLYFHKLNDKTDAVSDPADPAALTYQRSLAYQAQASNPDIAARVAAGFDNPALQAAARRVLLRLFSPAFVDSLAGAGKGGQRRYTNSASLEFSTPDGRFGNRLQGDGKTVIDSPLQVLMALSAAYEIAPGLRHEMGGRDFRPYIPEDVALLLAEANDAEDFYVKGPGIAELQPVNHAMAGQLLDDFPAQSEAAAATAGGNGARSRAHFRFSHAEILIPFATLLGLPGTTVPTFGAAHYRYADNPWRGENVAPYAANVQWDTYSNAEGRVLVRMLHNEGQVHFQAACAQAQFQPGSYFYDLRLLKVCYAQR